MPDNIHIFGIRHHGPGSARSVRRALEDLAPDIVLIEGPPDANALIPMVAHEQMRPPVALLVYRPDELKRAVYYPFAVFSPEWQAMLYAVETGIPARFMDLPQTLQMGAPGPEDAAPSDGDAPPENAVDATPVENGAAPSETEIEGGAELGPEDIRRDPLLALAVAAGYSDSERWWEHMVEQRIGDAELFQGILEAMTALRDVAGPGEPLREQQREAYMRQTIRAAQKEGFTKIAVVCGAWHAPALHTMPSAKSDTSLLAGLPKVKTESTWIPWTNGRLLFASGYGAGIESPGWYGHLWRHPENVAVHWLTRVGHLLREQDLDASPAHTIEAVRLAETLAALRDRPVPGLPELNEAIRAIFCFGSDAPLRLIEKKLIVGEVLGDVPDDAPSVPLQQDLARLQKRLRLAPDAAQTVIDLDLRKPNDLEKSYMLHRLTMLGVPWGLAERSGGGRGTFHEIWRLQWKPEFAVQIIEASVWGNTVFDAATNFGMDAAEKSADLPALTKLLDRALLAELPDTVRRIMQLLESRAALATDVGHLMRALPPLTTVMRYGNVRGTDGAVVEHVVHGLVARIGVGLVPACASMDDEAAHTMFGQIVAVQDAIALIQSNEDTAIWRTALRHVADRETTHGLVAGRCTRLLMDSGDLPEGDAARRLSLALSRAAEPEQAAAWVEGLLKGSGVLILHDDPLWNALDEWVSGLAAEPFQAVLPLMRRTFSTFSAPERRQMGERAAAGTRRTTAASEADTSLDIERAEAVLPVLAAILGLEMR